MIDSYEQINNERNQLIADVTKSLVTLKQLNMAATTAIMFDRTREIKEVYELERKQKLQWTATAFIFGVVIGYMISLF